MVGYESKQEFTLGVIGLSGKPYHLARPKSAILTQPLSVINRLDTCRHAKFTHNISTFCVHLEITMDNEGGVEVTEPAEHLLHDALDLRLRKRALHVVQ